MFHCHEFFFSYKHNPIHHWFQGKRIRKQNSNFLKCYAEKKNMQRPNAMPTTQSNTLNVKSKHVSKNQKLKLKKTHTKWAN